MKIIDVTAPLHFNPVAYDKILNVTKWKAYADDKCCLNEDFSL